jgi:hypothetical protein
MRAFLMLLKYLLLAIAAMTVFGGVGTMFGGVVARIVDPPPSHSYEGIGIVIVGAGLGAILGLIAVVALAFQEIKKKRQRSVQAEKAS